MVLGRHADWGRGKEGMGKTHKVQYVLKDRRTYVHMYALPRVHNLLCMHSWYTHTYSMYVRTRETNTYARTYVCTYVLLLLLWSVTW